MIEKYIVLRENAVDMSFLMKYCLLGMSKFESEYKEKYISLSKEFFDILSNMNISEEDYKKFKINKLKVMDSIFQVHHEFSEDDEKLELERKLMSWEYDNLQKKEDEIASPSVSEIIKTNTVSEEEFFNE